MVHSTSLLWELGPVARDTRAAVEEHPWGGICLAVSWASGPSERRVHAAVGGQEDSSAGSCRQAHLHGPQWAGIRRARDEGQAVVPIVRAHSGLLHFGSESGCRAARGYQWQVGVQ